MGPKQGQGHPEKWMIGRNTAGPVYLSSVELVVDTGVLYFCKRESSVIL